MTFDAYIKNKNMRLREVSDQLGISTSMVWQLRQNKASPSIAVARKIYKWSNGVVNFLVAGKI